MNKCKRSIILLIGLVSLLSSSFIGCGDPPVLYYSPSSFNFDFNVEGATPSDKTLLISNLGGGIMDWSVSSDVEWLSLNPITDNSTEEAAEVTVAVDVSGINPGNYEGTITISTSGESDSVQTIPVILNIVSKWHEESLIVNCANGQWCEESILFTMEEHQEIHLLWSAYGDNTFIAVFLEKPDGTCDAGYAGTHGGAIDSYTPTRDCHFFREPFAPYHLDLGKSGILNFYCSTTYNERSKARIYPPGQYRLNFDVVAESPFYNDGKEGDPIQTIIKVKYRIE